MEVAMKAFLFLLPLLALAQPPAADHMHRRFDDAELWAKNFDDPARDKWQLPSQVITALQLKPTQTVADIGAGTGYFTVRLSPAVARVFAVDIEESMVNYTRHRAMKAGLKNVTGVVAKPDSANIPEPVDLILIVDTFHHIPAREAYFRALAGGPMGPPEAFRFSPEKIAAELAKAGWKKVGQHTFLPNQSFTLYQR
jgi:protein-L-isoaspartate O-methyltransferase